MVEKSLKMGNSPFLNKREDVFNLSKFVSNIQLRMYSFRYSYKTFKVMLFFLKEQRLMK